MPVTYTNRKGVTYTLCRGTTKIGRPRYTFAREPQGEVVDEIPAGFKISESVNGIVSLVRARPAQIRPAEIAAVEAAVRRHPRARNYRVNVKDDRVEVYERAGPGTADMVELFQHMGLMRQGLPDQIQTELDQHSRFAPILRFILADAARRTFRVERMHFGGRNVWFHLSMSGPVDRLAARLIPTLGTERFFELY